jgi:hypothetical protein
MSSDGRTTDLGDMALAVPASSSLRNLGLSERVGLIKMHVSSP